MCNIHLKRMKHMVATCAHLLVALPWRFVNAELDVITELEVAHDRQVDGSRPRWKARGVEECSARCKARAGVHSARRGRGHMAQGAGAGGWSYLEKDERPKGIIIDIRSVNVVFIVCRNVCPIA
jgi:hypothetical protein